MKIFMNSHCINEEGFKINTKLGYEFNERINLRK